jgi:hypothetical protein
LWALLDDVDTAGDMFKPPINSFFDYVIGKSEQRHRYLQSDGYSLVLTQECAENIASDTKESSQTAPNRQSAPVVAACTSGSCGWFGLASECHTMKHGFPPLLCPECHNTVETRLTSAP